MDINLLRKHYNSIKPLLEMPSKRKAKKMLDDDSAQGHSLTDKQKKLFRAVSHGWKPKKKK